MQESQWAGLLAMAAGAFAMTASIGNWDWFMNSRKARAWVKRIGRDNARRMYGGIGAFVCLFGLLLVVIAPGDGGEPPAVAQAETPAAPTGPESAGSAKPTRAPQPGTPSVVSTPNPPSHESTAPSAPGPAVTMTPPASDTPQPTSAESATPPTSVTTTTPREPGTVVTIPDTTAPQTTATPVPVTALGQGTDLLRLIDPQRDQLQGRWTMQNGTLISPKDRPANLQIPADVPASYQLSAVVELADGNELFSLGLVVGGHGVAAVLSGPGGNNCGLQTVDSRIARQNETYYRGAALQAGENEIVCTVNENHVQVDCNGQTIIDWTGDPNRLSYNSASNPTDRLLIGSWNTSCRVSQLTLTPQTEP